ncbi:4'-phosphopantetheinyl transferase superfamily protein [Marinobacter salinisoli]|uniref:Enterobactin synthase component D n=1 Tax=Marinobacter salinisoli TaxID=2769486 RepID=A0ABX7MN62_9GAMM|nr:4'-phosphopantetheinyl transferase superfamily protein [Marinobacter salinisoli]QSP93690.1 4'-phosphopantetheinyl transferase superfamily protein [Marinobacter salinisoli]
MAPMSSYSTENLEKRLTDFTGTHVFVASGPLNFVESPYQEERDLVSLAVEKRQMEFFTGRKLARQALSKANAAEGPILRGPTGNPIWPDGIVGSITHDRSYALAVVAQSPPLKGLGIDLVENTATVTSDVGPLVMHDAEFRLLTELFPSQNIGAVAFSIKESVVKALSPHLDRYLDMLDIHLAGDGNALVATLSNSPYRCRCLAVFGPHGLFTASFF